MTHQRVSRLDAAPRLAVVGATGAVGREMLACLEKRNFPLSHLRLFASQRSAGASLPFKGRSIRIEELTAECFTQTDIALFSASAAVARRFAPLAVESGAVVIDNSSAFRLDPDGAAGGAGDQRRRARAASRPDRQPELRGDHFHRAAVAVAPGEPRSAGW